MVSSGKVEICGVNTSKLQVLSEERKTELLARVKRGDENAREELIKGNLKLVLSVIKRFSRRGENPDDLFQVGCIGLIKAIDNFDSEAYDVKFSSYAVPMILGELRRFFRDNSSIRVSRSIRDLAYKALQAKEELSKKLEREPTIEEIARALESTKEEVASALDAIVDPVSLFDPVYSDNGDSIYIMDQLSDTKNTDEAWLESIALNQAISTLSPREKRIILMRFYDGKTQMEVAQEIDISQAQVSRLEKGALLKIKKQIT